MLGISILQYYLTLYKNHRRGLDFSRDYQLKLYNWFPPFVQQDLWLSRFVEGRGLLRDKPKIKAGAFTICGPRWVIRHKTCDLKIFVARENLAFRKEWQDFMLANSCVDLAIGFDDIKDNPRYIRIPFWMMWCLDPMETFDGLKKKIIQWNSPGNTSYSDRKFCSFLCSHGDKGREMILHELLQVGHVDSAGRWMHNDDSLKKNFNDDKLNWLRNYRFNLTPENSNATGYCTEKLLEAIQAGCVPIYWGADNRPEPDIFNMNSIIFFEMGQKNDSVISLIAELNADEQKYLEYACQPRFVQGAEDVIWGYYELLEKKLKEIIKNL